MTNQLNIDKALKKLSQEIVIMELFLYLKSIGIPEKHFELFKNEIALGGDPYDWNRCMPVPNEVKKKLNKFAFKYSGTHGGITLVVNEIAENIKKNY